MSCTRFHSSFECGNKHSELPSVDKQYPPLRSIYSDTSDPVKGIFLEESCNFLVQLRPDSKAHEQHIKNAAVLASASIAVGHFDPPPLIPIFTR